MNIFLIILGKFVLFFSKTFRLGSGSTWPGHIAMETNPGFLRQMLYKNKKVKTILVAGTNGKTTTSKMLRTILEENGLKVFQNEEGANLLNGMASTVVSKADVFGNLDYDVAIFETDENNVKLALNEFTPDIILILNIFRDQLDRYGEVNKIAKDWENAVLGLNSKSIFITNGDDPELSYIGKKYGKKAFFFGVNEKEMERKETGHDTDFNYCPACGIKLNYTRISFSHLGHFYCANCKFSNPKIDIVNSHYPLFGLYNIYNTNAATAVARLAFNLKQNDIDSALKKFKPAFGRQEKIVYHGKEIVMLLSKNPAGFNQSIESIKKNKGNVLLLLNDRIPDGRDVSWVWDVDFEEIGSDKKIFIGGDRAYDMALRIKYGDIKNFEVFEKLNDAINKATTQTGEGKILFILPTYSAMLEAREILTGRKFL